MYSKQESTGKRNLHYSRRHREYGWTMTMMDIDNVEYDAVSKQPLALIETKFGLIRKIDLNDHKLEIYKSIASLAGPEKELPFFILVYYPLDEHGSLMDAEVSYEDFAHIQYFAVPMNEAAKKLVAKPALLTEFQWVNILRQIHKQPELTVNSYGASKLCKDIKPISASQIPVLC